ncbi:MAG: MFS transporter [Thermodesulfobacteriota bacterium]
MAANTHEQALNKVLDDSRMTRAHWRVWLLSAMGVFLDGFDLFIIGVAMPVIRQDPGFRVTPAMEGALSVAALLGAVAGAAVMGYLTDRFGRKRFYIADLGFAIAVAMLCGLAWNGESLLFFRFLLGVAVGADYPISASYISEYVPARIRGRMMIAGFSFQALGMIAAAMSGLIILDLFRNDIALAWRFMLMLVAAPTAVVLFFRLSVPESTRWLLAHGRTREAADIIKRFVPERTDHVEEVVASEMRQIENAREKELGWGSLFTPEYLRRTVLVAGPWFFMDIATYGIGIFTPVILTQIAGPGASRSFFGEEWKAVEGAAFVDLFLVLGFFLNLYLVEKWGRIRLQLMGFLGMTLGLCLLAATSFLPGGAIAHMPLVFTGFIVFNLLMNMGPNSTTYILPVELFPTKVRASAHGLAAACAKVGAASGALLLPILAAWPGLGIPGVLFLVAGAAMAGFLLTALFRVETMGRSLDDLTPWEAGEALEHD